MVITGAKSEDLAEHAAKQYAKMIRKCSGKKNITMTKFHIENIVANVNAYFKIELEKMLHFIKDCNKQIKMVDNKKNVCDYEPAIFPGLIFRMVDPKVVLLIFSSGKIVLTGGKTRQ